MQFPMRLGALLALCASALQTASPGAVETQALPSVAQSLVLLTVREDPAPGVAVSPQPSRTTWATAFFVDREGLAATNHHVTAPALGGRVTIEAVLGAGQDGRRVPARVVAADPQNDLDLIRVEVPKGRRTEPLSLSTAPPDVLAPVQVWGFPNGMPAAANRTKGPEPAVTSGEVAALRRDEAGRLARLDITAAACPGSSGSPVLDSSGEVVAVVWGSLDPYGKFVSAVSAERVAALLTSVPCALRPPAAAPASGGLALSAAPLPTQLSRTPLTSQVPPQPVSPVPRVVICLVVLSALMAALLISRGSIRCGSSTHR